MQEFPPQDTAAAGEQTIAKMKISTGCHIEGTILSRNGSSWMDYGE